MTKILSCTCKHAWQDLRYGPWMRVFNQCGPKKQDMGRCTCCGSIREFRA